MSFTHTIVQKVTNENRTVSSSIDVTGGAKVSLNLVDADALPIGTNTLVNFALDVSTCKSFYIVSDVACTVKTNSSSSPGNTLTLVAGVPYVWHSQSYDTFKLTVDVTVLYITNVAAANIQLECLTDPTP